MRKSYFTILIITITLVIFLAGGCSSKGERTPANETSNSTKILPSLQKIVPDDPFLFLPVENVAFQLNFSGEVDPAVVKQSISFEPRLDFTVRSSKHDSGEIKIQPQERLLSDTTYTLQIKNVKDESTGKTKTLKFTYRTEFVGDKQIANPQWSHDGTEIIYLVYPKGDTTAELWKFSVSDGNEKLLATDVAWPGRACWSPDDDSILYTKMVAESKTKNVSIPEVRSVNRNGQKEKVIVSAAQLEKLAGFAPLNIYSWWSPDGKKIALQLDLAREDSHSDVIRSIAVADRDGSNLHQVDGQIFVGWRDNSSLLVLKTHKNYNHSRAYRYDLFLADTDGKKQSDLLLGKGQISNFDGASQSADLDTLAMGQWRSLFTGNGFKHEGTELLLYDASHNSLTPLGLESGYHKHPAVSPTGKKIVFAGNQNGNWDLYLQNNGTVRQLTGDSAHEFYPAWSPTGDKLAFVSTRSGREEIWLLQISSGKLIQLTGTKK